MVCGHIACGTLKLVAELLVVDNNNQTDDKLSGCKVYQHPGECMQYPVGSEIIVD